MTVETLDDVLGIQHDACPGLRLDGADVAHLPAGFCVERALVEEYLGWRSYQALGGDDALAADKEQFLKNME